MDKTSVLFSAGIYRKPTDSLDQSCCNIEERPRDSYICVLEVVDVQAEIRTCRFVVGANVLVRCIALKLREEMQKDILFDLFHFGYK